MKIYIKKIQEQAILPEYAHRQDAGMDLFSVEDVVIKSRGFTSVGTGICVQLPKNTVGYVCSKSGLAARNGIAVLNSPGVVDEGYAGEVKVVLFNVSAEDYQVKKGQKIAQLVVQKVDHCVVKQIDTIKNSDRGEGAFGSTGLYRK